ncbi:phage tail assembly protein [Streptomyces sp. NPDC095614]|uniref:phage tail assembly protein n=1 Tax=Streptomyces sp. NPDC095614 TaxID=3156692 RepID=UPI00332A0CCC
MADATSIKALREEAEDRYPGLPLTLDDGTTVTLRNILRLDDAAQKNVATLIESLRGTEGDTSDQLDQQKKVTRDLLLLVCDNPKAMAAEMETWDLALYLLAMEKWQAETQLPEASSSAE